MTTPQSVLTANQAKQIEVLVGMLPEDSNSYWAAVQQRSDDWFEALQTDMQSAPSEVRLLTNQAGDHKKALDEAAANARAALNDAADTIKEIVDAYAEVASRSPLQSRPRVEPPQNPATRFTPGVRSTAFYGQAYDGVGAIHEQLKITYEALTVEPHVRTVQSHHKDLLQKIGTAFRSFGNLTANREAISGILHDANDKHVELNTYKPPAAQTPIAPQSDGPVAPWYLQSDPTRGPEVRHGDVVPVDGPPGWNGNPIVPPTELTAASVNSRLPGDPRVVTAEAAGNAFVAQGRAAQTYNQFPPGTQPLAGFVPPPPSAPADSSEVSTGPRFEYRDTPPKLPDSAAPTPSTHPTTAHQTLFQKALSIVSLGKLGAPNKPLGPKTEQAPRVRRGARHRRGK